MRYYLKRLKALLLGWKNQPTKKEIDWIECYYEGITREVSDSEALDLLDNPEKNDLLLLRHISEYADMGQMKAIMCAFKLGYLAGKGC